MTSGAGDSSEMNNFRCACAALVAGISQFAVPVRHARRRPFGCASAGFGPSARNWFRFHVSVRCAGVGGQGLLCLWVER